MPSWDDDDQLVTDPQTQISLIWYGHKGGLEDRVFRIRTERSSVTSMPEPRTSHNISNVEILAQGGGVCELRFNWVTFSYRYKTVDTYFGTSFYTLDTTAAQPLIKRKKVVLKNAASTTWLPPLRRARRRRGTNGTQHCAQFRGWRHALHRVPPRQDHCRRLLSRWDQHPARLSRRRLQHLQMPGRIRGVRPRQLPR
jgi:3-phenylpropionate/cinnamic acid dioxygenase small subunit